MKEIFVGIQVPESFEPGANDCEGFCPFSKYDCDTGELTCNYNKETCPLITKTL